MATDNGNGTVTVVAGDSLWAIATKYYKQYGHSSVKSYVDHLAKINDLDDPDIIAPGDVIRLSENATGGTSSNNKVSTSSKRITIKHPIAPLSTNNKTLFISWNFDNHDYTEKYIVQWGWSWGIKEYHSVDHETTKKYDTFQPEQWLMDEPLGHVSVVILPVSKTYDVKQGDETVKQTYFEGEWSTVTDKDKYYFNKQAPIEVPSAPTVEIEDSTLTAILDDIPNKYTKVDFKVCKMSGNSVINEQWKVGTATVAANTASYSWPIELGYSYKVACRYSNDYGSGEWSDWSGGSGTKPSAPSDINTCRAVSETEVYLEWNPADNADSYEIEYTTNKDYFDSASDVRTITGIKNTCYFITGLESGDEYFFRVRAVNKDGESGWTTPAFVTIGTKPAAPTTWSSTTTVITGEELILYWVHNSEDGSTQTRAEIEMTINGRTTTETIHTASEDDDDKTMHYSMSTSGYAEGATILWRVRTAGATGECGDWSVQRTVTVYARPTLSISLPSTLTSFPLRITGDAGPHTQTPVGYHISIVSNSFYETLDNIGNGMIVNKGDEVYSEYIDDSGQLACKLSAGDLDLENNVTYTVTVTVSMDSGLTAEDSRNFTVAWVDEMYEPNAEVGYNRSTYTMTIRPYCKNRNGSLIDNVLLSVYRREYDGKFTEIATGLKNMRQTYVTDPHPALDYARYRIVAISETTGSVSYSDLPGRYIGESAIIIQWDDVWRNFDSTDEMYSTPPWSGSLLRLPYNIDVTEDFDIDVSLVEYIGREHPVSYYGTQRGVTSTWNVEIPKSDKETLYGIRRLAAWMGNVYVREPSGTGYWARIKPSFNQKHLAVVIPITLSITRVEGGA